MTCTVCRDNVIEIYKKRSKTIKVTLTGIGDITGSKIWFSVKSEGEDTDLDAILSKKTLNNGGSDSQAKITDGLNGVVEIYILPEDTDHLEAGSYVYDVVIQVSSGSIFQAVIPSKFILYQPITLT